MVDDHPMVREGLAMRVSSQSDLEICGEASAEDEAFDLVKQVCPDLLIVDIALKKGNGIELIKRVHAMNPAAKMLVVSAYQETLYAERALRAGALGYLNKQESNEKVIEAIRTVLRGQRFVSERLMQRLVTQALGSHAAMEDPIEQLTDRELEVFRLIGQGFTSGTIAEQLFLSTHTIDSHREHLKRKLNVKSATELNRLAVQWSLENA
ncbi:Oxygen regulatory protein NreC [Planctomycetes bacterium CA13]|uniref:Oxygen regulatory protein NreC n=1 Tax=Novipirellula herctigrandis TaxID=2527986 RepID=A0A5C5Z7Z2_9BACT|nr:Oxygen regulatory protein NreC [Planctomycetes bacterium CA13]